MNQFHFLLAAFALFGGTTAGAQESPPELVSATVVEEAPETSPSSPPLETDDPGTPGRHGYEINLITSCERTPGNRSCSTGIDAAFGLGDKVQFRISKARLQNKNDGEGASYATGSTNAGFKIRFWESNGWQVATYPSFDFDDGSRERLADGSYVESEGRSVYLPIIVSKDLLIGRERFTIVGNVGYRKNLDHAENDSIFTSASIGKAINDRSRVMGELVRECDTRYANCRRDVRIGYVKVLFPRAPGRYQTSLFTSVGIGKDANGLSRKTVLVGLSIARKAD